MSADAGTIQPGPVRGRPAKGRLAKYGLRTIALGYLFALLLIPVVLIFFKAFDDGVAHAWESVTTPGGAARVLPDDPDRGDRGAVEHRVRNRLRARAWCARSSAARRS